jgi:hypothetical protein
MKKLLKTYLEALVLIGIGFLIVVTIIGVLGALINFFSLF